MKKALILTGLLAAAQFASASISSLNYESANVMPAAICYVVVYTPPTSQNCVYDPQYHGGPQSPLTPAWRCAVQCSGEQLSEVLDIH
jgi:hypothetical protein